MRENFGFPVRVCGVGLVVKSTFLYHECLSFFINPSFFQTKNNLVRRDKAYSGREETSYMFGDVSKSSCIRANGWQNFASRSPRNGHFTSPPPTPVTPKRSSL